MRKKVKIFVISSILILTFSTIFFLNTAYVPPVLMYHFIGDKEKELKLYVSPEGFEKQMHFLHKNRYNVVGLDKIIRYIKDKKRPPLNTVAITFDDGDYSNYKYAWPVLKEYRLPATIFVITDKIGQEGWLGWKELKEMSNSGLITIASHTRAHTWLPDKSNAVIKEALVDSKKILEDGLGKKVDYLCYPLGAFSERVKKAVKAAGYKAAFTTSPGPPEPDDDIYAIKRVRISNSSNNLLVFWLETSGYYTWVKNQQKEMRWLKEY